MLKQAGFSLSELMIASTISLFVIAGALQLYSLNIQASHTTLRQSRLNQELRAILDLLRNDLRRAGYWLLVPGQDDPAENPFQATLHDVTLGAGSGEPDSSCIRYSFDLNGDGLIGVGASGTPGIKTSNDNLEQFAIRLRNGQVQMRNGGSSFDCSSGSWQAITDSDTEITTLHFALQQECLNLLDSAADCSSGSAALLRRQIQITLAARSISDPRIIQELNNTVTIANDKLFSVYP